jgi:hypothetical protein
MNKEKTKIPGGKGGTLHVPSKGDPSPNPNGRPKGSKNRSTLFRKWMEMETKGKNPVTGKDEEMTVEDKMILKIISKALVDGDVSAFREAMDSMYGKHKDQVEIKEVDKFAPLELIKQISEDGD